jgi:hypothetical protein
VRTTLELDDDLVALAKELARQQGATLGEVISALARESLVSRTPQKARNGIPLFTPKPGSPRPDLNKVNDLRDD